MTLKKTSIITGFRKICRYLPGFSCQNCFNSTKTGKYTHSCYSMPVMLYCEYHYKEGENYEIRLHRLRKYGKPYCPGAV